MCNGLPRTCLYRLYVALLLPPATALASVDAFVFQKGPAFIIDNGTNVAGHAAAELAEDAGQLRCWPQESDDTSPVAEIG